MEVFVRVKSIGKKKAAIDRVPLDIEEEIQNSDELIAYIVRRNVQDFNAQKADRAIFPYLTRQEIDDNSYSGKVGFQDKRNGKIQDEDKAVANALECYADGIFKVFINEKEIPAQKPIALQAGDEIVFIRLTMLAGALW